MTSLVTCVELVTDCRQSTPIFTCEGREHLYGYGVLQLFSFSRSTPPTHFRATGRAGAGSPVACVTHTHMDREGESGLTMCPTHAGGFGGVAGESGWMEMFGMATTTAIMKFLGRPGRGVLLPSISRVSLVVERLFLVFFVMWWCCRGRVAACGPDPRLRFVVGSMIASGQAGETGIGGGARVPRLSGVSGIVGRGSGKGRVKAVAFHSRGTASGLLSCSVVF